MKKDRKEENKKIIARFSSLLMIFALAATLLFLNLSYFVSAVDPSGATMTNVSSSEKTTSSADFGNHSKGAIHTILLQAEQQDTKWKAYVGNVSSTFVLDDADGYSIYQWDISSFTGQVYITRLTSAPAWADVSCASVENKSSEDIKVNHTTTAEDSVNSTFTQKAHKSFYVGGTVSIVENDCYSIATWVNDTQQTPSTTQPFTELLLWDNTNDEMIYTTFVESDRHGYKGDESSINTTYDFQAIVPDDAGSGEPAERYYFYLELTSN